MKGNTMAKLTLPTAQDEYRLIAATARRATRLHMWRLPAYVTRYKAAYIARQYYRRQCRTMLEAAVLAYQ